MGEESDLLEAAMVDDPFFCALPPDRLPRFSSLGLRVIRLRCLSSPDKSFRLSLNLTWEFVQVGTTT